MSTLRNCPEIISTFPKTLPATRKSTNGWAFAGGGQWVAGSVLKCKLFKDNS